MAFLKVDPRLDALRDREEFRRHRGRTDGRSPGMRRLNCRRTLAPRPSPQQSRSDHREPWPAPD
jgi:hypothetical protein